MSTELLAVIAKRLVDLEAKVDRASREMGPAGADGAEGKDGADAEIPPPEPRVVVSVDADDLILAQGTLREAYALIAGCKDVPQQVATAGRLVMLAMERMASMHKGRPSRWE